MRLARSPNSCSPQGGKGLADCSMALARLFAVLLEVAKVMAPFTPFLTETMYQNLRRCLPPGAPESIHFCDVPAAVPALVRHRPPPPQPAPAPSPSTKPSDATLASVGVTHVVQLVSPSGSQLVSQDCSG